MKILCWNCRGVGNPATVRELKQLLVANDPDIVFLCETKCHSNCFPRIRYRCRMDGCMAVNAEGKSSGLALMWRERVKVTIQNYSKYHIDSLVNIEDGEIIKFTGFYGHFDPILKKHAWDILKRVKRTVRKGWIVGGDFNAIRNNAEKEGGRRKPRNSMDEFCEFLEELSLTDVKTKKGWFTWSNNREGNGLVKERLDRLLVSDGIINKMPFLNTSVIHQSIEDTGKNLGQWQYQRYKSMKAKINVLEKKIDNLIDGPNSERSSKLLKSIRDNLGHLSLNREFTDKEILAAFNQMDPRKAPNIDGLPGSFFKEHWHTLGVDVLRMCHETLNNTKNVNSLNETLLIMIPKIDNPCDMTNFRPISLCRFIYKIVSKVLANRMKEVLPSCISLNQSAFVPGRMIHDNMLIAHELMHHLFSSKNGPSKGCVIKLDMSKAYDRVEWDFFENVLLKFGFSDEWVNKIMCCVCTVRYKVKCNMQLTDTIVPERGLRQGDPLSPYLFLFCMEVLSRMLIDAQENLRIRGIHVVDRLDSYLGLPIPIGKKRSKAFKNVAERTARRINSWSKCLLSYSGKEIFIKSVLQSIPTYAFSIFLAPKTVLEEIQSMMCRAWWGSGDNKRNWNMLAWEKMCHPKGMGGLGFRDLRLFNVDLLGRQVWRLLNHKDTLCYRVLSSKYFPDRDVFHPKKVDRPSFTWQNILKAACILYDGFDWCVGNGRNINIWMIIGDSKAFRDRLSKWIEACIRSDFNSKCPRCGNDTKTLIHALKDCPKARAVLEDGGFNNMLLEGVFVTCTDWIEEVARVLDITAISDFITVLWNIWNSRNNRIFRGAEEEAKIIWERASALSKDFRIFNLVEVPLLPRTRVDKKWKKPAPGVIKINADAAVKERYVYFGLVARDCDGFVIGGRMGTWNKRMDVLWAEMNALKESIKFASLNNWEKVEIETDCADLVNHFKKRNNDVTSIGYCLRVLFGQTEQFNFFDLLWAPRCCNRVADLLCNLARDKSCNMDFNMDYPLEIHDSVLNDAIN
ncbi:LINE-1 reverse transcriptase isogeny [Gossypium australe]|uniref:LINE-1 reverse transcriptase isogeny n=1 Tax=Gossypium australe TaxID=47621 RepID=A0A5B6V0H0_9ROSI|nr:LINE-1 reverse transcriptase isogeny [Gossypium australe]